MADLVPPPIKATCTILIEQEGKPAQRITFPVDSLCRRLNPAINWFAMADEVRMSMAADPSNTFITVEGRSPVTEALT